MAGSPKDIMLSATTVDSGIQYIALFNDIKDAEKDNKLDVALSNAAADGARVLPLNAAKQELERLYDRVQADYLADLRRLYPSDGDMALAEQARREFPAVLRTVLVSYPSDSQGRNFGRHIESALER